MFPHISARSFRTTELAKGFAKMGHDVTLYAILGKYDYTQMGSEFPNLHIKTLGKSLLVILIVMESLRRTSYSGS